MKWRSLKSTIKQAVTRALVCPFGILPNDRLKIICHQNRTIFLTLHKRLIILGQKFHVVYLVSMIVILLWIKYLFSNCYCVEFVGCKGFVEQTMIYLTVSWWIKSGI